MSLPPGKNILKHFPNPMFIETGSYRGDAIQLALEAECFSQIRSMDLYQDNVSFCHSRFNLRGGFYPNMKVIQGDSATDFWKFFQHNYQATIWLDAHSQLFEDEPESANPFPLLMELAQIANHPVKSHTILIDDILVLTHPDVTGWNRTVIEDALRWINPGYQFTYVANPVRNNLLIATI